MWNNSMHVTNIIAWYVINLAQGDEDLLTSGSNQIFGIMHYIEEHTVIIIPNLSRSTGPNKGSHNKPVSFRLHSETYIDTLQTSLLCAEDKHVAKGQQGQPSILYLKCK